MVDQIQPNYDLARQAGFYGAGGKQPGQYDTDKVNAVVDTVGNIPHQYNQIIAEVLANKKARMEQQPVGSLFGDQKLKIPATTPMFQAPEAIKIAESTEPKIAVYKHPTDATKPPILQPEGLPAPEGYMSMGSLPAKAGITQAVTANLSQNNLAARGTEAEARQKRFDENLTIRKQEFGLKRQERLDKMNSDVISKYNADPDVKKADSAAETAVTIRELVLSDNPIAANAVPTYMSKMAGEVGNLSENDRKPFGGSKALLDRLDAISAEWSTGQLSTENKKYLVELTRIIEKRANETLDGQATKISKQYGQMGTYGNAASVKEKLRPGADAPPPAQKDEFGFTLGEVKTNKLGASGKYLGNGKWQLLQK